MNNYFKQKKGGRVIFNDNQKMSTGLPVKKNRKCKNHIAIVNSRQFCMLLIKCEQIK